MLCACWAAECPACACRWSWPKTFLHGEGAAVGIAIFNSVGALGGFCGARSARECIASEEAGAPRLLCFYVLLCQQCRYNTSQNIWYELHGPCFGIVRCSRW